MWEGVANRYWHLPVYFVPTCILRGGKEETTKERQAAELEGAAAAQGLPDE